MLNIINGSNFMDISAVFIDRDGTIGGSKEEIEILKRGTHNEGIKIFKRL